MTVITHTAVSFCFSFVFTGDIYHTHYITYFMAHSFYAYLAPPIVVGVLLTRQSLDSEFKTTAFFHMYFQEKTLSYIRVNTVVHFLHKNLKQNLYVCLQEHLFAARVVYDLLFFFLVIIIVLNLIFGVIIDTFADLRSEKQRKEEILKTTCFICGEMKLHNYAQINKDVPWHMIGDLFFGLPACSPRSGERQVW